MNETSSIGPEWPPGRASYHRIKGIDSRRKLTTDDDVHQLLQLLSELSQGLAETGPSRISLRVLIEDRLLGRHLEALGEYGEAVVPLTGCGNRFEGCSLLYVGHNHSIRRSDADELAECIGRLEQARQHGQREPNQILQRVRNGGYQLRMLGLEERLNDRQLQDKMAALYVRFGWSAAESRDILANRNSLIAVGQLGDEVVSAGIAELSHIRFADGSDLRIAEFTEAATLAQHQQRGLYTGVVVELMCELARQSRAGELLGGSLNLAFGESSGHDLGVLIAAIHLGRQFAHQLVVEHDWPFSGYLAQHVPIEDGAPRSTTYNDLFPSYISRQDLYRFVADVSDDGKG